MTADWLSQVAKAAQQESAAGRFSGAILICQGGQQLFAQAYGLADRERGIANTLDTRFRHGSISKSFTGVAVGQLIQAGLVDPAAPLGTYLSEHLDAGVAGKVSIHHLLTHTGGTGDIFGKEYTSNRAKVRTIADYLALFAGRKPRFEPGTRFEYSNFGFILLGAVIEAVSGQNYYDYLDEKVFAVAGMTRTGSLPEESAVPDLAVGYTCFDAERPDDFLDESPNTGWLPYRGSPAGGGYSTVEDLWRFATALTGHRLLDEAHTTMVTTARGAIGWTTRSCAYGFFETTIWGVRSFGHQGGAPGMSADLAVYPATGHLVAVLSNLDPPAGGEASSYICSHLPLGSPGPAD